MSLEPPKNKSLGTILLQVAVGTVALILVVTALVPHGTRISERGNLTRGLSNCRQLSMALKFYADDHNGNYPDAALNEPRSSNEVFRVLFQQGVIDNEMIFGCPVSPFVPDGNIGEAPGFEKAVEAGENHWAMTWGLADSARGEIPLVYENPAQATWTPAWNAYAKGTHARGRTWSTGVIVGLNDGAVALQPLESRRGTAVTLKKVEGKDIFEAAIDAATFPQGIILDVEQAP